MVQVIEPNSRLTLSPRDATLLGAVIQANKLDREVRLKVLEKTSDLTQRLGRYIIDLEEGGKSNEVLTDEEVKYATSFADRVRRVFMGQ